MTRGYVSRQKRETINIDVAIAAVISRSSAEEKLANLQELRSKVKNKPDRAKVAKAIALPDKEINGKIFRWRQLAG